MNNKNLPLVENFLSMQGEGIAAGRRAYFLRFAGCDFDCSFCDETAHHVQPKEQASVEEIMKTLDVDACDLVILTGGNPCVQNLTKLVAALNLGGFEIHVETQGSVFPTWLANVDLITVSPKNITSGNATDLDFVKENLSRFPFVRKQIKPLVFVDKDGNVDGNDLQLAEEIVELFEDMHMESVTIQLGDDSDYSNFTYAQKYGALVTKILEYRIFAHVTVLPQLHKLANVI